jgi:RNA-binding protein YhbY
VIDDGAELIKCFANSNKKVWFAVEQTSSGFRKLEKEQPEFPVVNVARSATKLVQESPHIARLCFERIASYLSDKAVESNILIVGLGAIGEAILQIFKQNHYSVSGFDIKHGHSNLLSSIQELNPNVVIGATGFEVLTKKEIDDLLSDKPLHLISVSSSDREFPVSAFRSGNEIHKDVIYKNVTFVNNGFPITFKGNKNELTPVEIEKTICLLGGSVLQGITNDINAKGLVNVAEELENLIN